MKPGHERNQECLPPKKRDLPVSSSCSSIVTRGGADGGGGGEGAGSAHGSDSACREPPAGGGPAPGEWIRVQPGAHYGLEGPDGLGVPIDQYGMLYKVTLPSGAYPPTSLHPVLSHIPPSYSVPSSLLQHAGVPYPPLGYAHMPHSSLQLVGSPYAVPYAVPPGFVPGSMLPPPTSVPQAHHHHHHVPHLVPYHPSVIQGGVVSPPPPQSTARGPSPATAVFYHQAGGSRSAQPSPGAEYRDSRQEREKAVNGGEEEEEEEEERGDSACSSRAPRAPHMAPPPAPVEAQRPQDWTSRRFEARGSPGLHSAPDPDPEVGSRLASPDRGRSGGRRQASLGPLNLSQGSQREREEAAATARGEEGPAPARIAYVSALSAPADRMPPAASPHRPPAHHAAPPPDYHHQQQRQHRHHAGPPNDIATAAAPSPRAFEPPPAPHPPDRPALPQPAAPPGPSHFTRGAIIQLATGELKRVEDLRTQDFVRSAEASGGLKIDSSMVADIRRSQRPGLVALHFTVGEQQSKVAIDVPPEHPFFVFGQGWSSCSPEATARLYGLDCHHLQAGDVCVSIALQQHKPPQTQPQTQTQSQSRAPPAKASPAPAMAFQPMGPPAPQYVLHTRPAAHFRGERPQRDRREEEQQGGRGEAPFRADDHHARGRGPYRLHSEGPPRPGAAAASAASSLTSTGAAHRRCSAPAFQKYQIKSEDAPHPHPHPHLSLSPGSSRPTFVPQEVKLSIEGRSNAGK